MQNSSDRAVRKAFNVTSSDEPDIASAAIKGKPITINKDLGRNFLYTRYDLQIGDGGIETLGLSGRVDPDHVNEMDRPVYLNEMQLVGSNEPAGPILIHA